MSKTVAIIQAAPLILARDDAAKALGISTSGLEALVRRGELPRPRRISEGRTGWLWRDLLAFAESRPVSDLSPGPGKRSPRAGRTGG